MVIAWVLIVCLFKHPFAYASNLSMKLDKCRENDKFNSINMSILTIFHYPMHHANTIDQNVLMCFFISITQLEHHSQQSEGWYIVMALLIRSEMAQGLIIFYESLVVWDAKMHLFSCNPHKVTPHNYQPLLGSGQNKLHQIILVHYQILVYLSIICVMIYNSMLT